MNDRGFVAAWKLPLDPVYAHREWSVRHFFITLSFAVVVLIVAWVGAPRGWIDVSICAVTVHVALLGLVYAAIVFVVGVERFCRPSFWPLRLLDNVARLTISACFAASASSVHSPAWALVLLFGMIWPNKASFNPLVIALILIVPGAMRLGWAPSFDPSGQLVALGVSLAALLLYTIGSYVAQRQRLVRQKGEAQLSLAAAARDQAIKLKAAMSLHDGLSGALFAARHVAHRSASAEQICASAAGVLKRARRVVADILVGGFSQRAPFEEALRAATTLGGQTASLSVNGDPARASDALSNVVAIVAEATSNAARHGQGPISVALDFGKRFVTIRCESRLAARSGARLERRGLRNIQLRAAGYGGVVDVSEQGDRFVLVVRWPIQHDDRLGLVALGLGSALFMAIALGFSFGAGSWNGLFFGVLGLSYLLQIRLLLSRSQRDLDHAIEERRVAEGSRAAALVEDAFGRELAALEGAVARGDRLSIRTNLDELAETLRLTLDRLEEGVPVSESARGRPRGEDAA